MKKKVASLVLGLLVVFAALACEKKVEINLTDDEALKRLTKEDINKLFRDFGDNMKGPSEIGLDPLEYRDTFFPAIEKGGRAVKVHDVPVKIMLREGDPPDEFIVVAVDGYGTERAELDRPKPEGRVYTFAASKRSPRIILVDRKG